MHRRDPGVRSGLLDQRDPASRWSQQKVSGFKDKCFLLFKLQ